MERTSDEDHMVGFFRKSLNHVIFIEYRPLSRSSEGSASPTALQGVSPEDREPNENDMQVTGLLGWVANDD